jgi:hypothetical protein
MNPEVSIVGDHLTERLLGELDSFRFGIRLHNKREPSMNDITKDNFVLVH